MPTDNLRLAVALNGYGLMNPEESQEILPWSDVLEVVATVEETGYEALFTPEIGARDAFASLAVFAERTERLTMATGVVPIWSREVRRMAMGAATVNEVADGRFVLGLGSLDTIEMTREYVHGVRTILGGGTVAGGDARPIDLVPTEHIPIFLAALGPRMTELAGEVADGVILNWCTPERVAAAREQIAVGAERAGRSAAGVMTCVFVRACLGVDEDHALAALAPAVGRYAAMPKYARQFQAMGLGDDAARAAAALEAGRAGEVSERLLRAVAVWGTREQAMRRFREYRDAGADLVVVYPVPVGDAASSIMGTILAAAPEPAIEA